MAARLCRPARRVDQRRLADTRPTLDHENPTAPFQQNVDRRQLALALDQLLHATTLRRGGRICATRLTSLYVEDQSRLVDALAGVADARDWIAFGPSARRP